MKRITVLIAIAATLVACADATAPRSQLVAGKGAIAHDFGCIVPTETCTPELPPPPPETVPLQPGCFFVLQYDANGNLVDVLVCP